MPPKRIHKSGPWFLDKRRKQNLTQAQLASMVGKDRSYITQIEGGTRWPSEPVLYDILDALQVPAQEAIEELHLVKNEEVEKILEFMEFVEEAKRAIPEKRVKQFQQMFSKRLDLAEVAASLAHGERVPPGPEGWMRLHPEDRRLLQRIVNRLLDSYPPAPEPEPLPSPVGDEG